MKRIPVMVKLVDADFKEHVFGPITVEVDEPKEPLNHPLDPWFHNDNEARKYLIGDMSCDSFEGAIRSNRGGASCIRCGEKLKGVTALTATLCGLCADDEINGR